MSDEEKPRTVEELEHELARLRMTVRRIAQAHKLCLDFVKDEVDKLIKECP